MGNEGSRSDAATDPVAAESGQGAPGGAPGAPGGAQAAIGAVERDVRRVRWRRVVAGADGLLRVGARDGHCACASGGKVFVFGGVVENAALGPTESNDLFVFDPVTELWNVIEAAGDIPPPRSSASMASVGNRLFLFGGLSQSRGWMNTVFMFDTERNTWKELSASGSCPTPRDKLTATTVGHKIYVFGGFGPISTSQVENVSGDEEASEDEMEETTDLEEMQKAAKFGWFDNLFVFDTVTSSWSQPMQLNKGGPSRRAAHTAAAIADKLVIFGGRDLVARRNDLHVFNTETRKWLTDLSVTGVPPAARSFHSACSVGNSIIIFGGRGIHNEHFNDVHVLDTELWHWSQPVVDGEPPSPRGLSTATVVGDHVVVFGGSSDFNSDTMQCQSYFDDTYILNVDDLLREKSEKSVDAFDPNETVLQRVGDNDVTQTTCNQSSS